jgi:hypothetical protein
VVLVLLLTLISKSLARPEEKAGRYSLNSSI